MPYPKPTDPRYCPGSGHPTGWTGPSPKEGGKTIIRCAYCKRPIRRRPNGSVFPHVNKAVRHSHDDYKEMVLSGSA